MQPGPRTRGPVGPERPLFQVPLLDDGEPGVLEQRPDFVHIAAQEVGRVRRHHREQPIAAWPQVLANAAEERDGILDLLDRTGRDMVKQTSSSPAAASVQVGIRPRIASASTSMLMNGAWTSLLGGHRRATSSTSRRSGMAVRAGASKHDPPNWLQSGDTTGNESTPAYAKRARQPIAADGIASSSPGVIRTRDRRIRNPLLCPLSYGASLFFKPLLHSVRLSVY